MARGLDELVGAVASLYEVRSPVVSLAGREECADASTISQAAGAHGGLLAVDVTVPSGSTRQLLPTSGLVTVGRASSCAIVIDDPRVSRSHAIIRLSDEGLQISDLGSNNGTYVADERVLPASPRWVRLGQPILMGDSVVVIRASGLVGLESSHLVAPAQLMARMAPEDAGDNAESSGGGWAVIRVHHHEPWARAPEAVAAARLRSRRDWLARLAPGAFSLGIRVTAAQDADHEGRTLQEALASWRVDAEVEAVFVSDAATADERKQALAVLDAGAPLWLRDGAILVHDDGMRALYRILARIAPTPVNVLIQGETGVGKDFVASLLHEMSPRARAPFQRINCASLPEALLESELFGYERGAFTGAAGSKIGLLEAAEGGTVFLDEIGELSLPLQAKLLVALESREVQRLGATRARRIEVRFVAATNRELLAEVARGGFRPDLYYRLNGFTVAVPPLRQRPGEIALLAHHFLNAAVKRFGLASTRLSAAAVACLRSHPWPGNVRELRNVIERAVLLAADQPIEPAHLGLETAIPLGSSGSGVISGASMTLSSRRRDQVDARPLELDERERLVAALAQCAGNQSRTAEMLAMSRRTLVRRIADLGLPRPRVQSKSRG